MVIPGTLPVLVMLLRIELVRVGLFRSAAADGAIEGTVARVDEPSIDLCWAEIAELIPLTDTEEDKMAEGDCGALDARLAWLEPLADAAILEDD